MAKYPIKVQLTGGDGNAFNILGSVSEALREHLREEGKPPTEIDAAVEEYVDAATSGDYDHLLQVTVQWVGVA